ncbi:carbohydrate ABC transporter permease [Cohnella hongkongensis]|uniref:Carbohydrate ABC transporter permease n=1 Tax=Cohnella hongkongensis TaxID=178337 RepID=A0ABV9FHU3_9BACL
MMYVPALILFVIFIFYPFFKGLQLSLTNWNGFSPRFEWIGLDNYKRMIQDRNTWLIIKNTLIFGAGSTILQNVIGFFYALLLNQGIRTKEYTRMIVYLPVIISPLIMGYIWYYIFRYNGGAANDLFLLFSDTKLNLLANPQLNVWIITLVNTYQFLGISMIIYLAGLQSISKEYYEAAEIDGASKSKQLAHVVIPLLTPAITISVMINLILGLKLFDVIIALTNGGPGYASQSLSTMMYQLYFAKQDAGYASSLGILLFVLISVISFAILRFLKSKEVHA